MRVFDLFSGIGGFSLGLERAGMKTIAFCEVDKFCRSILAKHWPGVPILSDVTKIGVTPMSCAGDSHVKTCPTLASAPALPESVPVSGRGYAVPFAWYDRSTRLWRTWQACLLEGWTPYSGTWPRSGMTRNGIAYQLAPLAPLTNGIAFGLLPTPRRTDADRGLRGDLIQALRGNRNKHFKLLPTHRKCSGLRSSGSNRTELYQATGTKIGPTTLRRFEEWMMGYPAGWTDLPPSETP